MAAPSFQTLLKDTEEYCFLVWGQSNSRPWGHRDLEGFLQAPWLNRQKPGMDITANFPIANPFYTGGVSHGLAGSETLITTAERMDVNQWVGAEFRAYRTDHKDPSPSFSRLLLLTAATWTLVGTGANTVVRITSAADAPAFATRYAVGEHVSTFSFTNPAVAGFAVTMTSANPGVFTSVAHGRQNGDSIVFTTTGVLPTGLAGVTWYIKNKTNDTFEVSATPWGISFDTSVGTPSGTHTGTATPYNINRDWIVAARAATTIDLKPLRGYLPAALGGAIGMAGGFNRKTSACVGYGIVTTNTTNQLIVKWSTPVDLTNLCAGHLNTRNDWHTIPTIEMNVRYRPPQPGPFPTGSPVMPGRTLAAQVTTWNKFSLWQEFCWDEGIEGMGRVAAPTNWNVGTLTLTLEAGADDLVNCWKDGTVHFYDHVSGHMVARGTVASNTANAIVLSSLIGTLADGAISANTIDYKVFLPHWRNHAYAETNGEGFLHPSNESMPTPFSGTGWCYDRSRNRRSPGYVECDRTNAPVDVSINATGIARILSTNMKAMKVGGVAATPSRLRILRTTVNTTPSTQEIQFTDCLRIDDYVTLAGWTIGAGGVDINGGYYVRAIGANDLVAPNGSSIDLEPATGQAISGPSQDVTMVTGGPGVFTAVAHGLAVNQLVSLSTTGALLTGLTENQQYAVNTVPTADTFTLKVVGGAAITTTGTEYGVHRVASIALVTATPSATASVTRQFNDRQFRMGALVELGWQLALKTGRKARFIHVSCNSAGQTLQQINQQVGFQGQNGDYDYRKCLDWTPARPDGMFSILANHIEAAKYAMTAEGRPNTLLKCIGVFGWQGEGDALTQAGRDNYAVSLPTFYDALFKKLAAMSMRAGGKTPVNHAMITGIPYEYPTTFPSGGGDAPGANDISGNGAINRAIVGMTTQTFPNYKVTTFRADAHPKLTNSRFGTDPLHFDGRGEVQNGDKAAAIWAENAGLLVL